MLIASNWICEEIADRSFVFRSACASIAVSSLIDIFHGLHEGPFTKNLSHPEPKRK